ncbi:hypothetical protein E2562_017408 [Oryza meyeriana var. granulata]|uniref:Uncharacterized protein n=1 Tax=Oryza meyeriana var. granulata TaxID=110450 RepID=A0A6G1D524_9ORYZ|nr:hypothetical protein E2562_017408 [Oryza meyeriana var. granulata]
METAAPACRKEQGQGSSNGESFRPPSPFQMTEFRELRGRALRYQYHRLPPGADESCCLSIATSRRPRCSLQWIRKGSCSVGGVESR